MRNLSGSLLALKVFVFTHVVIAKHGVIAARSPQTIFKSDGWQGWLPPIRWKNGLTIETGPKTSNGE
ncbi:hypothetical protein, partial [Rhizobium leguminosarum]|uniref:hypothetical protein n=1 Tax=Rhizobium leguminosarum TaxID=384 RepID=UPI00195309A6